MAQEDNQVRKGSRGLDQQSLSELEDELRDRDSAE
jgi:hypothetical protein